MPIRFPWARPWRVDPDDDDDDLFRRADRILGIQERPDTLVAPPEPFVPPQEPTQVAQVVPEPPLDPERFTAQQSSDLFRRADSILGIQRPSSRAADASRDLFRRADSILGIQRPSAPGLVPEPGLGPDGTDPLTLGQAVTGFGGGQSTWRGIAGLPELMMDPGGTAARRMLEKSTGYQGPEVDLPSLRERIRRGAEVKRRDRWGPQMRGLLDDPAMVERMGPEVTARMGEEYAVAPTEEEIREVDIQQMSSPISGYAENVISMIGSQSRRAAARVAEQMGTAKPTPGFRGLVQRALPGGETGYEAFTPFAATERFAEKQRSIARDAEALSGEASELRSQRIGQALDIPLPWAEKIGMVGDAMASGTVYSGAIMLTGGLATPAMMMLGLGEIDKEAEDKGLTKDERNFLLEAGTALVYAKIERMSEFGIFKGPKFKKLLGRAQRLLPQGLESDMLSGGTVRGVFARFMGIEAFEELAQDAAIMGTTAFMGEGRQYTSDEVGERLLTSAVMGAIGSMPLATIGAYRTHRRIQGDIDRPFRVLDLDRNATMEEVDKAFIEQATRFNPDNGPVEQDAEFWFRTFSNARDEIKQAFDAEQAAAAPEPTTIPEPPIGAEDPWAIGPFGIRQGLEVRRDDPGRPIATTIPPPVIDPTTTAIPAPTVWLGQSTVVEPTRRPNESIGHWRTRLTQAREAAREAQEAAAPTLSLDERIDAATRIDPQDRMPRPWGDEPALQATGRKEAGDQRRYEKRVEQQEGDLFPEPVQGPEESREAYNERVIKMLEESDRQHIELAESNAMRLRAMSPEHQEFVLDRWDADQRTDYRALETLIAKQEERITAGKPAKEVFSPELLARLQVLVDSDHEAARHAVGFQRLALGPTNTYTAESLEEQVSTIEAKVRGDIPMSVRPEVAPEPADLFTKPRAEPARVAEPEIDAPPAPDIDRYKASYRDLLEGRPTPGITQVRLNWGGPAEGSSAQKSLHKFNPVTQVGDFIALKVAAEQKAFLFPNPEVGTSTNLGFVFPTVTQDNLSEVMPLHVEVKEDGSWGSVVEEPAVPRAEPARVAEPEIAPPTPVTTAAPTEGGVPVVRTKLGGEPVPPPTTEPKVTSLLDEPTISEPEPAQAQTTWRARTLSRAVEGREEETYFPGDKRKVLTRYTVVEESDLYASNDPQSFAKRPEAEYPGTTQGRVYDGERGKQARDDVIMQSEPNQYDIVRALDATVMVTAGVPTITPSGVVVAGNQRAMMLQRALGDPAVREEYQEYLRTKAAEFGLGPGAIDGFTNPVLVRVITDSTLDLTDEATLKALNTASDVPDTKAKDLLSDAATRASQLKAAPRTMDHFMNTSEADQTLREYLDTSSGREFVRLLLEENVIAQSERAGWMDAKGVLTDSGRDALERMFRVAAIGDADALATAPPSALRKLDSSLGALVQARAVGEEWGLGPALVDGFSVINAARELGWSVDATLTQSGMFGDIDPFSAAVAKFMEKPVSEIRPALKRYAAWAREAEGQKDTEDMFGTAPTTPAAAQKAIFGVAPRDEGPGLFGEVREDIERYKPQRTPLDREADKTRTPLESFEHQGMRSHVFTREDGTFGVRLEAGEGVSGFAAIENFTDLDEARVYAKLVVDPEAVADYLRRIDEVAIDMALEFVGGEQVIKMGVDPSLAAKLQNLYQADYFVTAVKELIQNHVDATRGVKGGFVTVVVNSQEGSITVTDNGKGMTPAVLTGPFVDIGGSGKQGETDTGAYGLAKASYLTPAAMIEVTTVAEDDTGAALSLFGRRKRLRSGFTGTGAQWAGEGIQDVVLGEETKGRTGTTVKLTYTPEYDEDQRPESTLDHMEWEEQQRKESWVLAEDWARTFVGIQRTGVDVSVVIDGREVKPYRWMDTEVTEEPIQVTTVRGANLVIRTGTKTVDDYPIIYVMNRGQYQFQAGYDEGLTGLSVAEYPAVTIIDISSTVKVEDRNYPFVASREGVKGETQKAVKQYIQQLKLAGALKRAKKMMDALAEYELVGGTEVPVYRTYENVDRAVEKSLANRPVIQNLGVAIRDGFDFVMADMVERGRIPEGHALSRIKFGMGFAGDWRGLNISGTEVESLSTGDEEVAPKDATVPNVLLVNPFNIFKDAQDSADIDPADTTPIPKHPNGIGYLYEPLTAEGLADSTWNTITHELGHQNERNHKNEWRHEHAHINRYYLRDVHQREVLDALTEAWDAFLSTEEGQDAYRQIQDQWDNIGQALWQGVSVDETSVGGIVQEGPGPLGEEVGGRPGDRTIQSSAAARVGTGDDPRPGVYGGQYAEGVREVTSPGGDYDTDAGRRDPTLRRTDDDELEPPALRGTRDVVREPTVEPRGVHTLEEPDAPGWGRVSEDRPEYDTDLFGEPIVTGPTQGDLLPESEGPQGMTAATDNALAVTSLLKGRYESGALSPNEMRRYEDAQKLLRYEEGRGVDPTTIRHDPETLPADEYTMEMFPETTPKKVRQDMVRKFGSVEAGSKVVASIVEADEKHGIGTFSVSMDGVMRFVTRVEAVAAGIKDAAAWVNMIGHSIVKEDGITVDIDKVAALMLTSRRPDVEHMIYAASGSGGNIVSHVLGKSGSFTSTDIGLVDVALAFHRAKEYGGVAFLGHNHPSGRVKPSMEDINGTRTAIEAAERSGTVFGGHYIVNHNKAVVITAENIDDIEAMWKAKAPEKEFIDKHGVRLEGKRGPLEWTSLDSVLGHTPKQMFEYLKGLPEDESRVDIMFVSGLDVVSYQPRHVGELGTMAGWAPDLMQQVAAHRLVLGVRGQAAFNAAVEAAEGTDLDIIDILDVAEWNRDGTLKPNAKGTAAIQELLTDKADWPLQAQFATTTAEELMELANAGNGAALHELHKRTRVREDMPRPEAEAAGELPPTTNIKTLLSGEEVLPLPIPGKNLAKVVGGVFKQRAIAIYGRVLDLESDQEIISQVLADEVQQVLDAPGGEEGNAAQWYSEKLEAAFQIVGRARPAIVSDPIHLEAFRFALAITSNEQKVRNNAKLALQVYDAWAETGRFDTSLGWGVPGGQMRLAWEQWNKMADAIGEEKLSRLLDTTATVAELNAGGLAITSELQTEIVPVSTIFGSKLGGAFFRNLGGIFDAVTMDRWFRRTIGRITGDMMVEPTAKTQRENVTRLLASLQPEDYRPLGYTKDMLGKITIEESIAARLKVARAAKSRWERTRKALVKEGQSKPDKPEWAYAAERYIANLDPGIREAPVSPSERSQLRVIMRRVQELVEGDHDLASIQAILWYPEKRLYTMLGVYGKPAQKALLEGDALASEDEVDYETAFREIFDDRIEGVDTGLTPGEVERGAVGEARRLAGPESTEFRAGLKPDELTSTLAELSAKGVLDVKGAGAGPSGLLEGQEVGREVGVVRKAVESAFGETRGRQVREDRPEYRLGPEDRELPGEGSRRNETDTPEGWYDHIQLPTLRREAATAATGAVPTAYRAVREKYRYYQESLIDAVKRQGGAVGKELAQRAERVTDNTKALLGLWDEARSNVQKLVAGGPRHAVKTMELAQSAINWLQSPIKPREGQHPAAVYRSIQAAVEGDIPLEQMPKRVQQVVEAIRELNSVTGAHFQSIGLRQLKKEVQDNPQFLAMLEDVLTGKAKEDTVFRLFTPAEGGKVFQRRMTPQLQKIWMNPSTDLRRNPEWDQLIEILAHDNNLDLAAVGRIMEKSRENVTKRMHAEIPRVFKNFPTDMRLVGKDGGVDTGKKVPLLWTHPAGYATSVTASSAHRSAFIEEFGQGLDDRRMSEAVDRALQAGINPDDTHRLFRALSGMSETSPLDAPDSPAHDVTKGWAHLMLIPRTMMLTRAAVVNTFEVLGNIQAFGGGAGRLMKMTKKLAASEEGWKALQKQYARTGLAQTWVMNATVDRQRPLHASVPRIFREYALRIFPTIPAWKFQEMQAAAMGIVLAEDMRAAAKDGGSSGIQFESDLFVVEHILGFTEDEVAEFRAKTASDAMYVEIARRFASRSNTTLLSLPAEESRAANSPTFNRWIAFHRYSMMSVRNLDKLHVGVGKEWGRFKAGDRGTKDITRLAGIMKTYSQYMGGKTSSGVLTAFMLSLLAGGGLGLLAALKDFWDEPDEFMAEGLATSQLGPIHNMMVRMEDDRKVENLWMLSAPLSVMVELTAFAFGAGRYQYMNAQERTGAFFSRLNPGPRAIRDIAVAMGLSDTDPVRDLAITRYWKWMRDNDVISFGGDQGQAEAGDRKFRSNMRRAYNLYGRENQTGNTIAKADEFVNKALEVEGKERSNVAISIRSRRLLPRVPDEQMDDLREFLGPELYSSLETHDSIMDSWARSATGGGQQRGRTRQTRSRRR